MELVGLAAATVIGASWMLKFIMARLARLEDDYRTMVTNHISHSTQAMVDVKNAVQDLAAAIRAMK